MEIERRWGQAPGWFAAQSRESQTQLLAWMRVTSDPKGERSKGKR